MGSGPFFRRDASVEAFRSKRVPQHSVSPEKSRTAWRETKLSPQYPATVTPVSFFFPLAAWLYTAFTSNTEAPLTATIL
jgi:hypothetical protein